jgi:ferrous iron transport protein A
MCVSDLSRGESFVVSRVRLGKEVGKRLADMGFTEGREGLVVRKGFFRGPLQVRLMGYDLLLRHNEASGIEISSQGQA